MCDFASFFVGGAAVSAPHVTRIGGNAYFGALTDAKRATQMAHVVKGVLA